MDLKISRKEAADDKAQYIKQFILDNMETYELVKVYNIVSEDKIYVNSEKNLLAAYNVDNAIELLDVMLPEKGEEVEYSARDTYFTISDGYAKSFNQRDAEMMCDDDDVLNYIYEHFEDKFESWELQKVFEEWLSDSDFLGDGFFSDEYNERKHLLGHYDLYKDDWYDLAMRLFSED